MYVVQSISVSRGLRLARRRGDTWLRDEHGTRSIITPHNAASETRSSGMSHRVCEGFVARSWTCVRSDIVVLRLDGVGED